MDIFDSLTEGDRRVLVCYLQGMSRKEIAKKESISPSTASNRINNITRKIVKEVASGSPRLERRALNDTKIRARRVMSKIESVGSAAENQIKKLSGALESIERHWPSQLARFDEKAAEFDEASKKMSETAKRIDDRSVQIEEMLCQIEMLARAVLEERRKALPGDEISDTERAQATRFSGRNGYRSRTE